MNLRCQLGEHDKMTDGSGARQFILPQAFHIHFRDIDPQHEGLVDVINDCADQLVDGELREFESAFSAFVARLTSHFKYEEDQMAELGYHGLEWHREHHQECLSRVRDLIETMREQGYASLQDLRICFHDILHDIARADLKYGEFLDAQRLRT